MKLNKKVAQKVAEKTAEVSTTDVTAEVKTAPVVEKVNTEPKNLFGHMCRLILLGNALYADAQTLQTIVKPKSKFNKKHWAWYKWYVKNNPQKSRSKACLSN